MATNTRVRRWQPHGNPPPYDVLRQAREDAAAGRHELALRKHDWFYRKAVIYEGSAHGPRLTTALADWVQLGSVFPPALARLRKLRDKAERRARARGGPPAFIDLEAINRYLGEENRTVETFRWLDRHQPLVASRVIDTATWPLLNAGEYRLCLKYLNPRDALSRSYRRFQELNNARVEDPAARERLRTVAEAQFCREAAIIIALLVRDRQTKLAELLVQYTLDRRNTPNIRRFLEKALKGKMPE